MVIIQKITIFLREVYVELKKVNWLSRQNVVRYTLIVVGVTITVSVFLGGLDYLFSSLIKKFVLD